MNEPRCGTCYYYLANTAVTGYCVRYPPLVTNDMGARLPVVHEDEWCGEYARRPLPMVSNAVSGRATA